MNEIEQSQLMALRSTALGIMQASQSLVEQLDIVLKSSPPQPTSPLRDDVLKVETMGQPVE